VLPDVVLTPVPVLDGKTVPLLLPNVLAVPGPLVVLPPPVVGIMMAGIGEADPPAPIVKGLVMD
jgi:hypothetical protein